MRPKTKKILGYSVLVFVVIAAAGAYYIYSEYNRRLKDTSLLKAAYSLPAEQLVKEFENNDTLAGQKYMDRVLEVKGLVKELVKDEQGYFTIVLGDTNSYSAVRCSMDTLHHAEATVLQKGMDATMKGICSGFNKDELLGSDVILVRSVVSKK
jgi:hypothetical protein